MQYADCVVTLHPGNCAARCHYVECEPIVKSGFDLPKALGICSGASMSHPQEGNDSFHGDITVARAKSKSPCIAFGNHLACVFAIFGDTS